jgi:hypothetical protein
VSGVSPGSGVSISPGTSGMSPGSGVSTVVVGGGGGGGGGVALAIAKPPPMAPAARAVAMAATTFVLVLGIVPSFLFSRSGCAHTVRVRSFGSAEEIVRRRRLPEGTLRTESALRSEPAVGVTLMR